jgi:hypothetical protein
MNSPSPIPFADDDDPAEITCGGQIFNGPTPAAARMRRLRERRARGARCITMEIDVDLLEALDELELVHPDKTDDPSAYTFALLTLVTEAVEARQRRNRDKSL